jgi:hypothetical protein
MRRSFLLLAPLAGACMAQAQPGPEPLVRVAAPVAAGPAAAASEPRVATFIVERRPGAAVGGAAAMMRDRLAVRGNCVLVMTEQGEEVVPVFSAGTASWDPVRHRLRYLGRLYAIGDVVPIGGGGVNPAMIPTILRDPLVDIPSDCPTSRLWFTAG